MRTRLNLVAAGVLLATVTASYGQPTITTSPRPRPWRRAQPRPSPSVRAALSLWLTNGRETFGAGFTDLASGTTVIVRWTSGAGLNYFVERTTNLSASPPFTLLTPNRPGRPGATS
jgi:hypothetical protein